MDEEKANKKSVLWALIQPICSVSMHIEVLSYTLRGVGLSGTCSRAGHHVIPFSMAAEEAPSPAPTIQKQVSVDTYKWSNRREDYELLEVIGM